jgi:hypothetical protein
MPMARDRDRIVTALAATEAQRRSREALQLLRTSKPNPPPWAPKAGRSRPRPRPIPMRGKIITTVWLRGPRGHFVRFILPLLVPIPLSNRSPAHEEFQIDGWAFVPWQHEIA